MWVGWKWRRQLLLRWQDKGRVTSVVCQRTWCSPQWMTRVCWHHRVGACLLVSWSKKADTINWINSVDKLLQGLSATSFSQMQGLISIFCSNFSVICFPQLLLLSIYFTNQRKLTLYWCTHVHQVLQVQAICTYFRKIAAVFAEQSEHNHRTQLLYIRRERENCFSCCLVGSTVCGTHLLLKGLCILNKCAISGLYLKEEEWESAIIW